MKFILIAAVSILSTLASGLALSDLTPRATVIRPAIAILLKQDFPDQNFPTTIAEVSRTNGEHTVLTLLGFIPPPCTGWCTISFSDAITATGTRMLQLFTMIGYPGPEDTYNHKPPVNVYLGRFLVPPTVAGPATVVEDFGLSFPCPATTTQYGLYVAPVGDNVNVTWDITKGGFILTCS